MDLFLEYRRRHDAACEVTPRAWVNFGVASVTHAYHRLQPRYASAIAGQWFALFETLLDEHWDVSFIEDPSIDWTSSLQQVGRLRDESCYTSTLLISGAPPGWPLLIEGLHHLAMAKRVADPTEHAIAAANSAGLAVRRWAQAQAEFEVLAEASPGATWRQGTPEHDAALRRLTEEGLGRFQAFIDDETQFQNIGLERAREGRFICHADARRGFYDPDRPRRGSATLRAFEPPPLRPTAPPAPAAPSEPPTKAVRVVLPHTSMEELRMLAGDALDNLALATATHAFNTVRPYLAQWVQHADLDAAAGILDEHWNRLKAPADSPIDLPGDWSSRTTLLLSRVAYQSGPKGDVEIWRWMTTALHGLDAAAYGDDRSGDKLRFAVQQAFFAVYRCAEDLWKRGDTPKILRLPRGPFSDDEREAIRRPGLAPLGAYENLVLAEVRFQLTCLDLAAAGEPIGRP